VLPDTREGILIGELLETISSGQPDRWEAFIRDHFTAEFMGIAPMESHISVFGSLYDQSRGFEIYDYTVKDNQTYIITTQDHLTGLWGKYIVTFTSGSPPGIAGLRIQLAEPPDAYRDTTTLSLQEIAQELERLVNKLHQADVFSGTVLLAKGTDPVLQQPMGFSSRRFSAPNRLDTRFNLGSMNKMFTAVAIAQLEERGQLAYEDSIGQYLDSTWIAPAIGRQVTLAHLLSHTSGLGSYFTPEFMESSRTKFRDVSDYKSLVSNDSLRFKPGTDWHYSNTGFLLLGAIIESITGESYFEYVRREVYQPAGMGNTDAYPLDEPVPNLAIGYEKQWSRRGVRWQNNIFKHVIKGGPAGGGFSTALDLLNFSRALRENILISAEARNTLTSPKPELNSPDYGFGFDIYADGRGFGHTGGFTGISTALEIYPEEDLTFIVLANYSRAGFPIRRKFHQLMNRYEGER